MYWVLGLFHVLPYFIHYSTQCCLGRPFPFFLLLCVSARDSPSDLLTLTLLYTFSLIDAQIHSKSRLYDFIFNCAADSDTNQQAHFLSCSLFSLPQDNYINATGYVQSFERPSYMVYDLQDISQDMIEISQREVLGISTLPTAPCPQDLQPIRAIYLPSPEREIYTVNSSGVCSDGTKPNTVTLSCRSFSHV